MSGYVLGYRSDDGSVEVHHQDGVAWHEAPIPRHWHRCRPQTRGFTNYFTLVDRCACGAIRMGGRWMERNARRKNKS